MRTQNLAYNNIIKELESNNVRIHTTDDEIQKNYHKVIVPLCKWIVSRNSLGLNNTIFMDINVYDTNQNREYLGESENSEELVVVISPAVGKKQQIQIPSYVRNIGFRYCNFPNLTIAIKDSESYTKSQYYISNLVSYMEKDQAVKNEAICKILEDNIINILKDMKQLIKINKPLRLLNTYIIDISNIPKIIQWHLEVLNSLTAFTDQIIETLDMQTKSLIKELESLDRTCINTGKEEREYIYSLINKLGSNFTNEVKDIRALEENR